MPNQLCCASCLWSSDRSANWWGHDTAVDYDEEEDSFNVDCGSADDDLIGEVPWHIQVSLMTKNQQMVPSSGGCKTKWYGLVSTGNERGKFVTESRAIQKHIDETRKRQQRTQQKQRNNEIASKTSKMTDIRSFLVRKTTMYPSVQVLLTPSIRLNFDEELQTLSEELDEAVMHMRRSSSNTSVVA
jgi:hypothetical protein